MLEGSVVTDGAHNLHREAQIGDGPIVMFTCSLQERDALVQFGQRCSRAIPAISFGSHHAQDAVAGPADLDPDAMSGSGEEPTTWSMTQTESAPIDSARRAVANVRSQVAP